MSLFMLFEDNFNGAEKNKKMLLKQNAFAAWLAKVAQFDVCTLNLFSSLLSSVI
jgi:hypothetical protein